MGSFVFSNGKAYDKLYVVGLHRCLVCGAVAVYLTAFCASVDYNVTLLWVGLNANRLHKSHAVVGSVARVYIKML